MSELQANHLASLLNYLYISLKSELFYPTVVCAFQIKIDLTVFPIHFNCWLLNQRTDPNDLIVTPLIDTV